MRVLLNLFQFFRRPISLGVCLFLLSSLYTLKAKPEPEEECLLRMGFGLWKPYQFFDQQGRAAGPHIEFIKEVAKGIDCRVEFSQMQFSEILDGVKSGELDWASLTTPTPLRRQFADFSTTYATEYFALYIDQSRLKQFEERTLKELLDQGFRLGITEKHFYGESFSKLSEKQAYRDLITAVPDSYQNYQRLLSGRIDGFLDNPMIAAFTIRDKSLQANLTRHPSIHFENPIAFMLSKKTFPETRKPLLNQVIEGLRKDPDFTRKWYLRP